MQLKKLFTEEHAVSSVIATILMVAVVVILAALIGTFVLGLGSENAEVGPSVSASIEGGSNFSDGSGNDRNGIMITHETGDEVEKSTLQIQVGDKRFLNDSGNIVSQPGDDIVDPGTGDASNPDGDTWKSGESYVLVDKNGGGTLFSDGDTVRVIWQSQNTNQTATIAKDRVYF